MVCAQGAVGTMIMPQPDGFVGAMQAMELKAVFQF
jgi:hypothetical protein